MKRILARLAFRLVLDSLILALHARALAYRIAAALVGIEIAVKDRLLGPGRW